MRTKIILATVTGGLLVALFATHVAAAGAPKTPPNSDIGRWQIVQGPPTGLYRTFLIDTATGATYIVCGSKDEGVEGWCPLPVLRPAAAP
jgi:hypothetical protein